MDVLFFVGFIYLVVGLGYALYLLFNGMDKWYNFPINWLLGPITLLINYYVIVIKKRFPR